MNRDLFNNFNIDPATFVNYILRLESAYQITNPYHNHVHAADVLQAVHVLLQAETLEGVFSDLEILSALFASAIHDANHPGLTNQYLINTGKSSHSYFKFPHPTHLLEQEPITLGYTLLVPSAATKRLFSNLKRSEFRDKSKSSSSVHRNKFVDLLTFRTVGPAVRCRYEY
ncbi:unnamed protein product [Dibothriocephalus latus]|uniref:PDEase domain-containing protein n=1 Tax=Dibothriocephalus latus TaxID=60516 RepID=A0A3P6TNQ9_DIBLA|nr:unnamed protein product [Dibothriocephalus latus]